MLNFIRSFGKHKEKWFAHIDITTKCHAKKCLYCSRFLAHLPEEKNYTMSLDYIDKVLQAYKGYPQRIGIIGGEPLFHPEFEKVCELLLKYGKRQRYGLWTSIDPMKSKYKEIIKKTFGFVAFNEHNSEQQNSCKHQPLTVAIRDAVENEQLRDELIEQCYFRKKWCYTVTPLGAYHCEIAAFIALMQGRKGWALKKDWWKNDWREQIDLCYMCGGAVPQERQVICNSKEKISVSFKKMLEENNCVVGNSELVNTPYSMEYLRKHAGDCPGAYRGDLGEFEDSTINIDWGKYL